MINPHSSPVRNLLLENFGQLYYYDKTADDAERHVVIIPLYALSNLC